MELRIDAGHSPQVKGKIVKVNRHFDILTLCGTFRVSYEDDHLTIAKHGAVLTIRPECENQVQVS